MCGPAQRTGRIRRASEFERALAAPTRARSEHFVIHHLPLMPISAPTAPLKDELSTGDAQRGVGVVDDLTEAAPVWPAKPCLRLGLVVPKRHARRSVTRQLVRRQIRACFDTAASRLEAGMWIVRLRAPFDPRRFASAASDALRAAVRTELNDAFTRAARAPRRPAGVPAA